MNESKVNEVITRLVWSRDRVLLDGLVFRIEQAKNERWDLGQECLDFFKGKWTIDQYAQFWASRPQFKPEQILELGIWDGGSVVFWFECFQPNKYVAVDVAQRLDSPYFRRYITHKGLEHRIKTYWGTDQANAAKLREIVAQEFAAPLDLVLDDASHVYALTKASFEILFPLLRPGGLYIIEDWAWAHWKEYQRPDHPWLSQTPVTQLVVELAEAVGSSQTFAPRTYPSGTEPVWRTLIANLAIYPHFVAIERSDINAGELEDFKLEQFISRRPTSSGVPKRQSGKLRRALSKLKSMLSER